MMTVSEFVSGAITPEEITVLIGAEEYKMINEATGKIDRRLLDMVGDFIVEDYKANEPDKYCVWVLMRPVTRAELAKERAGA